MAAHAPVGATYRPTDAALHASNRATSAPGDPSGWPSLGSETDGTKAPNAVRFAEHRSQPIMWPRGGGGSYKAAPRANAKPLTPSACRQCQKDIAHLPSRYVLCHGCFQRNWTRRGRTSRPARRRPAGPTLAVSLPVGGGREKRAKSGIKSNRATLGDATKRRQRIIKVRPKPAAWGALTCPVSGCPFTTQDNETLVAHSRSHIVLACPLVDCSFTAQGVDRCDSIATHTRSHGANRLRFTKTDLHPRPTSNPGQRYLCPWISTFYALLKSPPFAQAVVSASFAMSEATSCLKAYGMFQDAETNGLGGRIAAFLYHPMTEPLAVHLLDVLGARDDDVVSSDSLFHLVGAYLPARQGVQDHFGSIYADIQAMCPSLLPVVGASFTNHKVCLEHGHSSAVASVADPFVVVAKDGSHLLASLSPPPAPGPRCGRDGCLSTTTLHQKLVADQPDTVLVVVDMQLYDDNGDVADRAAINALPLQLDDEVVENPRGTELVVAAAILRWGQDQERGHFAAQDDSALANDDKLSSHVGPALTGAEVAGIVLTRRACLRDAPSAQTIRWVSSQLRSVAAGDAARPPREPSSSEASRLAERDMRAQLERDFWAGMIDGEPAHAHRTIQGVAAYDTEHQTTRQAQHKRDRGLEEAGPRIDLTKGEDVDMAELADALERPVTMTLIDPREPDPSTAEDEPEGAHSAPPVGVDVGGLSRPTNTTGPPLTGGGNNPTGNAHPAAVGGVEASSGAVIAPRSAVAARRSTRRHDLACSECTFDPKDAALTGTMRCPLCTGRPIHSSTTGHSENPAIGARQSASTPSADGAEVRLPFPSSSPTDPNGAEDVAPRTPAQTVSPTIVPCLSDDDSNSGTDTDTSLGQARDVCPGELVDGVSSEGRQMEDVPLPLHPSDEDDDDGTVVGADALPDGKLNPVARVEAIGSAGPSAVGGTHPGGSLIPNGSLTSTHAPPIMMTEPTICPHPKTPAVHDDVPETSKPETASSLPGTVNGVARVTAKRQHEDVNLAQGLGALDLDEDMEDGSGEHMQQAHTEPQADPQSKPARRDTGRAPTISSAAHAATPSPRLVVPQRHPSLRAAPHSDDSSALGTQGRRERITAQITATKGDYLRSMSTGAQPIVAYETLTKDMQNDGTTALDHAEHAFRYICLFIPLSGTATDHLSRPGRVGPVCESMEVLQRLFPGAQQAAVVGYRGAPAMKLKFNNLEQLRAARLEGWRMGWLPEYPSGRGPGRILDHERLDHLIATDVMATSKQEAADTVMRRLRKLTNRGGNQVCAPIGLNQVVEKLPGQFTLYIDAYGLDSAELVYLNLNGKSVASTNCSAQSRTVVKVYGEGPLALCQLCRRRGHSTKACSAPSMYLQCDSNGLDTDFCAFIRQVLDGATAVFAGTNPMRKGDKTFGFAIFGDEISTGALAGAAALYTDGVLSHLPRITTGVHACSDCGQLDDDARVGDRTDAHSSSNSPLCGLHRRETLSGRKYRPNTVAPTRATPQFVSPKQPPKAPPHGPAAPSDPFVDESTAMTDDADPAHFVPAVGTNQPKSPVTTPGGSTMTPRSPSLKRGRTTRGAADPSDGATLGRPATTAPSPGLCGAQADMPPPRARPPPSSSYGSTMDWKSWMAKTRQGRPTKPPLPGDIRSRRRGHSAPGAGGRARPYPSRSARTARQAAADPPTGGWCDEWVRTTGKPKEGDEVVAVYSVGSGKTERSYWYAGVVSLANVSPVACFSEGYNLTMDPETRLHPPSDADTAGPGAWCIIKRTFP
jgi:hypothetical protein